MLVSGEQLADVVLPSVDEEIWRYSRIEELDLSRFVPQSYTPQVSGAHPQVSLGGTHALIDDVPDVFAALNYQHSADVTVRVDVAANDVVDEPIVIDHALPGADTAVFPRLLVAAGENSQVTVIERFTSQPGGLVVPVLHIAAAPSARVNYVAVNDLHETTWSIGHQQAHGSNDSSLLLATVALGGDYARTRTDVRAIGKGASARQVAVYFAGGTQMHDFRTVQGHDAPRTHSDLLFKGAVQDTASSVYTGTISIAEEAGGTSAHQTNRNLTLSHGAWAKSVPNLDIRTNDVVCSHASTVGPIDEAQRYYLESRGVRPEVAERLVVLGFFDEVLEQLPLAGLAAELKSRVATKLSIGGES